MKWCALKDKFRGVILIMKFKSLFVAVLILGLLAGGAGYSVSHGEISVASRNAT